MESTNSLTSHNRPNPYIIFLASVLLLTAPTAYSRNTTHMLSIQEALQSADFLDRLDPKITLYFGDQNHPKIVRSLGQFSSNKKTNAFNKSDMEACQWALLSALLSLQARVMKEGGNAVINISSYYKKNIFKSTSRYECHTGAIIAGVALTGEVVRLAE